MENELKQNIKKILKKNKVNRAGIFGSFATNKYHKNSDIDILIEIDEDLSLLDIIKIKLSLEKVLKKNVDLIEYKTIKPRIKDRILKEEIRIIWKGIFSYL